MCEASIRTCWLLAPGSACVCMCIHNGIIISTQDCRHIVSVPRLHFSEISLTYYEVGGQCYLIECEGPDV